MLNNQIKTAWEVSVATIVSATMTTILTINKAWVDSTVRLDTEKTTIGEAVTIQTRQCRSSRSIKTALISNSNSSKMIQIRVSISMVTPLIKTMLKFKDQSTETAKLLPIRILHKLRFNRLIMTTKFNQINLA